MANTTNQNNAAPKKVTVKNLTLNDLKDHWIEIPEPISSGDTLQFGNNWTLNNTIFHVTEDGTKIPNGHANINGGYNVPALEIDGFKNDSQGHLVAQIFPSNKLALVNGQHRLDDAFNSVMPPKQKQAAIAQARNWITAAKNNVRNCPIAYLTDNYVQVKDASGQPKVDGNGNQVYQISSTLPKKVVWRAQRDYTDPYNGTPDWYQAPVLSNSDHANAIALVECLVDYLRGVDTVNYDYRTPSDIEIVDSLVKEDANSIVVDAAGKEVLIQHAIMSEEDIPNGGIPTNNGETGQDVQLNTVSNGTQYNNIKDTDPSPETTKDTGNEGETGNGYAPKNNQSSKPASKPASTPKSAPKSAPKTSSTKSAPKNSSKSTPKSAPKSSTKSTGKGSTKSGSKSTKK